VQDFCTSVLRRRVVPCDSTAFLLHLLLTSLVVQVEHVVECVCTWTVNSVTFELDICHLCTALLIDDSLIRSVSDVVWLLLGVLFNALTLLVQHVKVISSS